MRLLQDDELTNIDVCKFKAIHKRKFTYEICSISALWLTYRCILPVLVCFDCIPVASEVMVHLFLRVNHVFFSLFFYEE